MRGHPRARGMGRGRLRVLVCIESMWEGASTGFAMTFRVLPTSVDNDATFMSPEAR